MKQDRIFRRNLPHFHIDKATFFVTWRLHPEQTDLRPEERTVVADAIRFFDGARYELIAYVVMNDHVHVIVTCLSETTLSSVFHSWKSFTANQLQRHHGRRGSVWQDESHDRVVRSDNDLDAKVAYVLGNPMKRWAVERYAWVWSTSVVAK